MTISNQYLDSTAHKLGKIANFVVLSIEEILLVMPQHEIQALEPVLDIKAAPDLATNVTGLLMLNNYQCPVYALDKNLSYLPAIPASYRVCAILNHQKETYALACTAVRLVARAALTLYDIPHALENPRSPIKSLMVHDGRLLLVTTASALFEHLVPNKNAELPNSKNIIPFGTHVRKRAHER